MEMPINNKMYSLLLSNKYSIYRHIILQIVILMITLGVFFDTPDKLSLTLNRFYGWIGYTFFINMLVYFNIYVLFPRYLAKNRLLLYAISVIAFTFFALFVMMVLQEYFYDISVTKQEPTVIAIILSLVSSMLAIFLFLGGISALLLFKKHMLNNLQIQELRLITSRSELNFLKSQINPHFLFNMLNNANILVEENPKMASYILDKLDDLLHYHLNDSKQDKIYLKSDIEFLTNYLDLEKTRRDCFDYKINIEGEINNVQLAPLLFIPFVENAVKHNLDSQAESYIHLTFNIEGENLTFICKNSTPSRTLRKKEGGLGLENIKRRLNLLFGNNYSLEQHKTNTSYTVKMKLKL